jgi:hypothetical protein
MGPLQPQDIGKRTGMARLTLPPSCRGRAVGGRVLAEPISRSTRPGVSPRGFHFQEKPVAGRSARWVICLGIIAPDRP